MEIKNIEKDEINLIISCLEEKIKELTPLIFDTYEKGKKRKKIKKIITMLEEVVHERTPEELEAAFRNAPKVYWTSRTPISLR